MQRYRLRAPSRRAFIAGGTALAAGAALMPSRVRARNAETAPRIDRPATSTPTLTTDDGTQIYDEDWGSGRPIVFSHGWPLTSDAWEDAMFFLAANGFRCIAADRRGHGRSSQPWNGNDLNTDADDLGALSRALDLRHSAYVGHSTGGGEVARYIGRYGGDRVAAVVLVSDISPSMLRTPTNPAGVPQSALDAIATGVLADRAQYFTDLSAPFYGANRPGSRVSQGTA